MARRRSRRKTTRYTRQPESWLSAYKRRKRRRSVFTKTKRSLLSPTAFYYSTRLIPRTTKTKFFYSKSFNIFKPSASLSQKKTKPLPLYSHSVIIDPAYKVCVARQTRKQVLHALKLTKPGGSGGKISKWREESNIRCK